MVDRLEPDMALAVRTGSGSPLPFRRTLGWLNARRLRGSGKSLLTPAAADIVREAFADSP
jgi:hypothetical protein